jgi:peroxiredoxin
VIVFYRGGWCPYCNLTLRAWQQRVPELAQRDASLVAISPQSPDNSLDTAEKNTLAFPVLSDSALEAARAFGIAFDLTPDLVEIYKGLGNDLPVRNGNGLWALPVPATFVIGRDGRVAFAHVEADYRQRAEPDDVLRVIDRLHGVD